MAKVHVTVLNHRKPCLTDRSLETMERKNMVVSCALLICTMCFPGISWARLQGPEGSEDIPGLAAHATFIFHARVLGITAGQGTVILSGETAYQVNVADLAVDRWYKGKPQQTTVHLKYVYPGFSFGSDCIDLQRTSSWLIFAKRLDDGTYELSDNCEGGLPMSALLAPYRKGTWLERLQRDLIAGLQDSDPDVRLANIARLGGLKLRSSGDALHEFIEYGSEAESQWSIYAALRSGDPGVLPQVEAMVIESYPSLRRFSTSSRSDGPAPRCDSEGLELHVRYEIANLRAAEAISMLATVAKTAKDQDMQSRALSSIRWNQNPRSLPALINLLSDPDPRLHSEALFAIVNITGEPACRLDAGEAESIAACKSWWGTRRPFP